MIVLPLIMPSVAAAAVIAFFAGWNEFPVRDDVLLDRSLRPGQRGTRFVHRNTRPPLSTVIGPRLVFSLPAIVFFLVVQRKIVAGLTAGAVKG